jgi:hypothetical protein
MLAPTTGPVDWDGDGKFTAISATADVDANVGFGVCAANPADKLSGFADWPDLSGIPFQYNFQCRSTGGPKGGTGCHLSLLKMTAPIRVTVPIKR